MSVQYLKGVGPARAAQLERLGLRTVSDILLGVPRRYEDRSRRLHLTTLKFGDEGIVAGKVEKVLWHAGKGTRSKAFLEVVLSAGGARCFCRWYNARYLEERFTPGVELEVYGKVMRQAGRSMFYHPDWRVPGQTGADAREWEGILPVYALTEDLPQRVMRKIVGLAVDQHAELVTESLPAALRERLDLPGISEALRTIHFPSRMADAARARRRLVFEEFLCMQLALRQRHGEERRVKKGHVYPPAEGLRQRFVEQLPFTLTRAQARCLDEILGDMRSPHPMHRLLQGDVGSGKTVVAASAMLEAVESGLQCALLAPYGGARVSAFPGHWEIPFFHGG
jgi:ATP-dependent DNA helicase RecG